MKQIRICSDVHGKLDEYLKIIDDCDYSIQLGDLGFDYSPLSHINHTNHRMFPGNHDNRDVLDNYPGYMGKYGEFELNGIKGFFISGAFSIDWKYRLEDEAFSNYKSWWQDEQLTIPELYKAVELYKKVKPDFMVTHTLPTKCAKKWGSNGVLRSFGYDPKIFTTNTQEALQECWDYHTPALWCYGHFHWNKDKVWHGTRFICKPELGYTDINENLEVV